MTLNNQPNENRDYSGQTGLKTWKWEKRHALLAIAGACIVLWWLGSQGKVVWMGKVSEWLPLLGGLALVGEQLIKLV